MKCQKCNYEFDPRQAEKGFSGHDEVVELQLYCPACYAVHSVWIKPEQWDLQDE